MVYGSIGVVITSNFLGFSLFSLAKIFIIIEFTGLLSYINTRVDIILELFLKGIHELTNFSFVSFPTEKAMQKDPANSIGSQWRGKLSENDSKPYILQEIGYLGAIIFLVYLVSFGLKIWRVENRLSDFLTKIRVNLHEMFALDFMGGVIRTISFYSQNHGSGFWQVVSYLVALFFLGCFIYEFVFQLQMIDKLYQKKEEEMTKLEFSLIEKYFDGLEKESVKELKFARFYNTIFLLKLISAQILIYTL
jgi:hypothetical protein